MNLFLFPHEISKYNGYGIVVGEDYNRLSVSKDDTIVWYTYNTDNKLKGNHLFIDRGRISIFYRFIKVLQNRPSTEISKKMLAELPLVDDYTTIFCGDTIFYRTVRRKYPEKHLLVRFHNCFYRIDTRRNEQNIGLDRKFSKQLKIFTRLEKEIFADTNTTPIFLSTEDQSFFRAQTGRTNSMLWGVGVNKQEMVKESFWPITRLVYFGGVESHKKKSLGQFISYIWPQLREVFPNLNFHLFGYGSHVYHDKKNKIWGHGFYDGDGWPYLKNGLYINPDVIGGGVKIKIKTYLENNIRFITTPYGFEGYDPKFIDCEIAFCAPLDHWHEEIAKIIKESQKK
ncbi:hypothetical protein [Flagellimonas lutaonensis]|uniref:Glycosyltransferase n=1 Tax=Flagellimonas lutaonensis TaxID=516051 RepID=A0A0D5YW29_9FLAO|nr:hypothetical protein [Allomuricauda lutaonensis]AKA36084.1 hypothetical protein VC82_2512 [Allomuricauda lutaonensis]